MLSNLTNSLPSSQDQCTGLHFLNHDILTPDFSTFNLRLMNLYPNPSECVLNNYGMAIKRILGFVALFLFLCILCYHKYKYKTFHMKKWVDQSIFTIFDAKKSSNSRKQDINDPNENHNDLNSPEKKIHNNDEEEENNEFKEDDFQKRNGLESKNVYIFDWESYCCLCCPKCWLKNVYNPITDFFSAMIKRFSNFISKFISLKSFSFYCVVFCFMLFRPFDYIFSMILANNCVTDEEGYKYLFMFWDLFSSFIYQFNVYFLVTFIVLRRELQRIDPKDKLARAELLRFTFNKGLGFGVLIFLIKFLLMANTGRYFPEIGSDPALSFYSLARQLIFLSLILKSLLRRRNAIKTDCEVVKEEAKIYLMLNYLYKNSIGKTNVFKYLQIESLNHAKEIIYDEERLARYLDAQNQQKTLEMVKIFEINDAQNFKNVLLKSSRASSYPRYTIWALSLDFFFDMVGDLLSLASYKLTYLLGVEFCHYFNFFFSLSLIAKVIELFLLPYLLFLTVKKKNFFGKEMDSENE